MENTVYRGMARVVAYVDLILGIFALIAGTVFAVVYYIKNSPNGYLELKEWLLWLPLSIGYGFQFLQVFAAVRLIKATEMDNEPQKCKTIVLTWVVLNAVLTVTFTWIFITISNWISLGLATFIRLTLGVLILLFLNEVKRKEIPPAETEAAAGSSSSNSVLNKNYKAIQSSLTSLQIVK